MNAGWVVAFHNGCGCWSSGRIISVALVGVVVVVAAVTVISVRGDVVVVLAVLSASLSPVVVPVSMVAMTLMAFIMLPAVLEAAAVVPVLLQTTSRIVVKRCLMEGAPAVSYTHLTLPTILLV